MGNSLSGYVLLCFILLVYLDAFPQNTNELDSLLFDYENARTPIAKKNGCYSLTEYYYATNIPKSVKYAKEGLRFATDEPDPIDVKLYYFLATAYSSFHKFDTAIKIINKALSISEELRDSILIGSVTDQKGYIFFRKGDVVSAYEFNNKASTYFSEDNDMKYIAKNKHRRGVYAKHLGSYEEAISEYLEAIRIYEDIGDHKKASRIFGDVGNLFNNTKDYENVLKYSFMALEIAIRMGDSTGMASTYNNIGLAYHGMKNDSLAISYYEKAMEINLNGKNELWLAYNLHNIGNIYSDMGHYTKAIENINKSIEIKQRLKGNNQLASSFSALGTIYSKMDMNGKAAVQLKKAIDVIGESIITNKSLVIYQTAADVNFKLENYKEACKYLYISNRLKDSVFSKEKIEALHDIQTKYETVKNEHKIKDLEYQQILQKSKEFVLIGGLVSLGLVLIMVVGSFFVKRKKDKELSSQKDALHNKEKVLSELEMERINRKKEELQKELNYKSKQLTTHALNMMQKNKLLQELQKDVIELSKNPKNITKEEFTPIIRGLDRNLQLSQDWGLFKKYFEEVNKEFYTKLKEINEDITVSEMRLAALVKLKLNIKETASVLNLEPTSVKTARYRLKKKLHIEPGQDLSDFINGL